MSTLSKKLFISILTLVLTVGAFTATTFAWFTLGNTANVNPFNAEVQTGAGLEVSFGDSGEWFNTITTERMQAYINALYGGNPPIMSAVTSEDGKEFYGIDPSTGVNSTNATTSGFIEFTLRFRSLDTNAKVVWNDVTLGGDSVTFASDIVFRRPHGDPTTVTPIPDSIVAFASHAARVSVTAQTYPTSDTPIEGTTVVYELAGTTASGSTEANIVTGANGDIQADGAHDYYARKGNPISGFTHTTETTGSALDIDFSGIDLVGTVHSLSAASMLSLVENHDQVSEDDYVYGEFVVRIWLEGWDANTYNVLFEAPLSVSLSFKLED